MHLKKTDKGNPKPKNAQLTQELWTNFFFQIVWSIYICLLANWFLRDKKDKSWANVKKNNVKEIFVSVSVDMIFLRTILSHANIQSQQRTIKEFLDTFYSPRVIPWIREIKKIFTLELFVISNVYMGFEDW